MKRLVAALGWSGLAVLAGGTLLAASARVCPVGEVMANLRFPFGLAGLAVVALLAARRRWRTALAATSLVALHVAPVACLWLGRPAAAAGGLPLRLASANLMFGTADPVQLGAFVDVFAPDVLGLLELQGENAAGRDWDAWLAAQRTRFPHQVVRHDGLAFGMALLSRFPLQDVAVTNPAGSSNIYSDRPCLIAATALVGERRVRLLLTHPERPGRAWRIAARRKAFDAIAAEPWQGPLVVFGDLNCTATSPLFQDLLRGGGLRDTREGFGPCSSWEHEWIPGRWIAIDHVLVRGGVGVRERGVGPPIGSDHRPVTAVLAVP